MAQPQPTPPKYMVKLDEFAEFHDEILLAFQNIIQAGGIPGAKIFIGDIEGESEEMEETPAQKAANRMPHEPNEKVMLMFPAMLFVGHIMGQLMMDGAKTFSRDKIIDVMDKHIADHVQFIRKNFEKEKPLATPSKPSPSNPDDASKQMQDCKSLLMEYLDVFMAQKQNKERGRKRSEE